MSAPRPSSIPEEHVAQRLEELAALDRFMRALREVRFVDERDQVREGPPPPRGDAREGPIPPRRAD